MTKEELQEKIKSCKALKGKSVLDVISLPLFADNLTKYMECQFEDRKKTRDSYKAMVKLGGSKKYKLPTHVIDKVLGTDEMITPFMFINAYVAVLGGVSERSASERKYIRQLGQQAWNKTIADIVCEEFPELTDYFFPKVEQEKDKQDEKLDC